MATAAIDVPVRTRTNWIISERTDLFWFTLGGAAALYALVFDVIPRVVLKGEVGLMSVGTWNQIIFSFFAAPGLLHYWIDGHIWKVRSDPQLRTYLKL